MTPEPERTADMRPREIVVANIRRIRSERNLTQDALADMLREAGSDMSRSVLTSLETGRRTSLDIEEVIALATVLRVDPWSLVSMPEAVCLDCYNLTPPGYTCNTCGMRTEKDD